MGRGGFYRTYRVALSHNDRKLRACLQDGRDLSSLVRVYNAVARYSYIFSHIMSLSGSSGQYEKEAIALFASPLFVPNLCPLQIAGAISFHDKSSLSPTLRVERRAITRSSHPQP
jgi:hypothetical protein